MPRKSTGLIQAYQLQDFTFNAAMALKLALTKEDGKMVITREDAGAICQLIKAWESCQERVRIHRGKPLPGSKRPPPDKASKGSKASLLLSSSPTNPERDRVEQE